MVPGTQSTSSDLTPPSAWLLLDDKVTVHPMSFLAWIKEDSVHLTYPLTKCCKFTIRVSARQSARTALHVPSQLDLYKEAVQVKKYIKDTVVYISNVRKKFNYQRYILLFDAKSHIKRIKNNNISKRDVPDLNARLDDACRPASSVVTNVSGASNTDANFDPMAHRQDAA